MNDGPPTAATRHVVDGGYALGLLAAAIVSGYVILAPSGAVVARPSPQGTVASVTAVRGTGNGPHPALAPAADGAALPDLGRIPADGTPSASAPDPARAARASLGTRLPGDAPPLHRPEPFRRPETAPPAPPRQPWPEKVAGRVTDADGTPIAAASVALGGKEHRTDDSGAFAIDTGGVDTPLVVKLPGHQRVIVEPTRERVDVVLKPQVVKAAYLTYFGVADRGIRGRVMDLLERTELNAVVIDVKGDRGWIPYRTEVEAALKAGAQGPVIIRDFEGMMADLRARGIYTIARIVTFKDNVLASARPDLAIIDTRTGKPWIDNEKLAWVDPFREEVWTYNLEIAKEAVRKGFDEIQFDYVRFPTDGKLGAARYAKPVSKETRLPTITAFLARARRELGALGVYVAADVFGYTAFNENDTDIGQRIEEFAPHLDYICPMVYPSGYHVGIPGYRNPVANPYAVVHESVRLIRKRAGDAQMRVRPWLQDFRDYAFDKRIFGVHEIRAQIQGSDDAGGVGWMLWNPRNSYTAEALRPKSPVAAR